MISSFSLHPFIFPGVIEQLLYNATELCLRESKTLRPQCYLLLFTVYAVDFIGECRVHLKNLFFSMKNAVRRLCKQHFILVLT